MDEFLGPIRLFSSDERCALLSEVSARSKYGKQVAEKVRRFCSYHRSNIGSVAFERFGSESNDMIIWMYQVLNVYLSRSEISKGLSFDPAFVNAIFHLVDAIKILGRHRSSVKAYVDQLLLDLSAVEYGNDVFTSDNFNLNGWIVEAKHAKKIIIFCPNPYSLYTSIMIQLCCVMGIKIDAVIVKKFTVKRFVQELKRDGFNRLVKKVFRKLILKGDENSIKSEESLKKLHDTIVGTSPDIYKMCKKRNINITEVVEFDDCDEFLSSQAPDLGLFTGGGMISLGTLKMFSLGVLNVHMGILPQYKGMDVVQAAVLENENAGLCAHLMSPDLDAGPIINTLSLSPLGYPSLEYLRNTMSAFSPILAFDSLLGLFSGRLKCTDQLPLGRQYYVMHPALMDLTNNVLKNQLQKQGTPNDKLSNIFSDVVTVVNAAQSFKH